jgi:hypothetical protein
MGSILIKELEYKGIIPEGVDPLDELLATMEAVEEAKMPVRSDYEKYSEYIAALIEYNKNLPPLRCMRCGHEFAQMPVDDKCACGGRVILQF